jgi:hypothetical protein
MPNEIIVVQPPRYETKTHYGLHAEPTATTDFDRFADLATSLVQVPKSEIDAQRADN